MSVVKKQEIIKMIAVEANSIVGLSFSPNTYDNQELFGSAWLNEQASKVTIGLNSFCYNFIENNLIQNDELSTFQNQCIAELGERKGKKAFKQWLNSLGSVVAYLAKGVMKFGRWFNTLRTGDQDVVRQNTHEWKISWLKKLMKFPTEDIIDMAVEGNLKEVVVGGIKEKKRELHVDGYAKILCDPHNLNLKGKIGRLVHYCQEKSEWLWELPDSELADSGLPDSGLATSNWFTAEQLEVANKPRNTPKQSEQKIKKPKDKCPERTQTVELKNQDESSPEIAASNIAPISTQAVDDNPSNIPVDVRIEPLSPSSNVYVHSQNGTGKENGRPLNKEVFELFEENKSEPGQMSDAQIKALLAENQRLHNQVEYEKPEAQAELELIRRDAEKIAFAKAESLFREQLQSKDEELTKLLKQQSTLSGKLIFTPQEFEDSIRSAIAVEQDKKALEVQAALAKAESHFNEQLQQKDLELAELLKQQSTLSGKLIFTPQEFEDKIRSAITAEREKSAFVLQANQEHHQKIEEKNESIQQQMSGLQPALYQGTIGSQSNVDQDRNTPPLDKEPDKEYDNLREEVEQYKAVVYSFVKASVKSIEALTPRIAQDSLSEMIAVSDQPTTEVNIIPSLTNTEEKIVLLEAELEEALHNNRNFARMVKELQINIELKDKLHKLEREATKDYNKNGHSSTKPRTLLPFEPSSNRKRK